MDREDLELFARSVSQATQMHTGQALDAALDDIGWSDALTLDPRAAIATLFEFQGASNATSSALGRVVLHALELDIAPGADVVLPAIGQWLPPGTLHSGGLQVDGLAPAALRDRESALVIASSERGIFVFEIPATSLSFEDIRGIDPHSGLVRVTGSDIDLTSDLGTAAAGWTSAVALARVSIAHELVGASRAMLELAREHALARVQFDRPISSFQAIRHRLAESRVAIDMAEAMLDAAWIDTTETTAAMAKAVAGRQARTTARHCQQVLAGIGFTTEHPLHSYIQRTILLDGLFGTAVSLTKALGEQIVSLGELPPLLPL
jgi:Acyl-CoA dehydrogenase, C-terminal domain